MHDANMTRSEVMNTGEQFHLTGQRTTGYHQATGIHVNATSRQRMLSGAGSPMAENASQVLSSM